MWKLIKIILALYVLYYVVSFYMTQSDIADFAGTKTNFGIAQSNMIAVIDFAAENRAFTHKQQVCPNITSSAGEITLSFFDNVMVCCNTDEWLVPYRDVGSNREYLCGKWPRIEIISQPLDKTKLQLGITELEQ